MANGLNNGQNSRSRTWIYIVAILVVVILVSAFMSLRPRRIRVTVVKPMRQDIKRTVSTNGKVEPIQNFEAHAPISTTVRRILVHEGQKVQKGQLLFQLDDASARAQLARAQAQMKAAEVGSQSLQQGGSTEEVLNRQADLAKSQAELEAATRNVDSVKRLQQKGAASQDEVIAAQQRLTKAQADVNLLQQKSGNRYSAAERSRTAADVADARAAVAAAQQMIEDSNIRAPFAGTIYAVPVRQGAWVNAGDLLIQEADLSAMQVRAYVDEPEIGQLAPGQNVAITWDAVPGRVWNGQVKSVPTTVVQRGTRTVGEVVCSVDNSDGRLIPNVNVNALVTTNSRPGALVVAREALRDDAGKTVLFIVKSDHLVRTEVQTGVANLTQVEILKGISENDVIASQSVSPTGMTDGIEVKIVENAQ